MSSVPGQGLIGRDEVLRAVLGRLDDADPEGAGIGLVGDPGVGKTALLRAAERHARAAGHTVLVSRGSLSETHLPYAGLHQLARPTLGRVDMLPINQREALLACFAMGASVEVNPFFASLAALELIVDAAGRAPVLVCLDDLDWMDQPSLDVLAFVARRIDDERVQLLMSSRVPVPTFADGTTIRWLPLEGLDDAAAAELLDELAPDLPASLRERVLIQSVGNPLALVELASVLRSGSDAWPAFDEDLPMTVRLETTFAARADRLGAASRAVLDVAAVDDGDGGSRSGGTPR